MMFLESIVNTPYNRTGCNAYISPIGLRKNINPINYMSVILGSNSDVATIQNHGERYTPEHRRAINSLPEPQRTIAHKNIITGEYVDSVYSKWITNTREGREFIDFLRREGNGKPNPGSIEEIFVVNGPDGMVAATMPDYVKSNIIINADFYEEYCNKISSMTGRSKDEVLARYIIPHELGHSFIQTAKDRNRPEPEVEFHNDMQMIRFYMGLANKYANDPKASEYITDAQVFTIRYSGTAREVMDKYISQNMPKKLRNENSKDSNDENNNLEYRLAA